MYISHFKHLTVISIALVLAACAGKPINPVSFNETFLVEEPTEKRVAVYLDNVPDPDISYPGASCLLCLGAAAAMNSTLSSHVDTLDVGSINELNKEIVDVLRASGLEAFVVQEFVDLSDLEDNKSEAINSSRKDHSLFKEKYGATHSLIVDLNYIGVQRNYASYVPTSDPFTTLVGRAYLVNNESNIFEWYMPIKSDLFADSGVWDEPDDFPGLTNAYYQNIEKTRESVLAPFKK